ncbi:unnamed protein product [Prunus armeniaca]|uniref:Peroxisomal membrane protein PEX16 n=1 Tax=Prunus armeniaca TaxID=36596 RepID=A0A6J5U1H0_PRUAR|nr:unnamed protein product [Prunus armeniaca]
MEAYKNGLGRTRTMCIVGGFTWLLPERFSESEIGPEAVTALFGVITAINEHIIETAPPPMHVGSAEHYSFPYALCISALKDLETLVEVVAQQYFGDEKKWNFIAAMEAIKVLVRLALFRNSGYKMLLHGGETPNDEKHLAASTPQRNGFTKPGGQLGLGYLRNNNGQDAWNLEGRALSALSRFGENARMVSEPVWLRRVQHQHAIMEPPTPVVKRPTLSTILSKRGLHGAFYLIGEALFITRPLIYVLFIRKYGVRSWIPWFLSWLWTSLGWAFFHELLRQGVVPSSSFIFLTLKRMRQKLESTEKVLEPVPIVGFLTAKLVELIVGAQTRYTYMSGS